MIRIKTDITAFVFIFSSMLIFSSCYKDGTPEPNPFEENVRPHDTIGFVIQDIDPTSIAGLYKNIFGPTCANSGCHDGTFEPDFRTMESSYHSMVFKSPIKNDGSVTYRVDPGNPNGSALMKRLSGAIAPEMPIEIEPDSDWWEKSDTYIQNIRDWIQNGAKDLSGNDPRVGMIKPSIIGAVARYDGMPILREFGYGPFMIHDSLDDISIYISFDQINEPDNFQLNEFILGYEDAGFIPQDTFIMEILEIPLIDYGLFGKAVSFTHKIDLTLSSSNLEREHVFFRCRVRDNSNTTTEIPNDNAFYNIKEYLSFKRFD